MDETLSSGKRYWEVGKYETYVRSDQGRTFVCPIGPRQMALIWPHTQETWHYDKHNTCGAAGNGVEAPGGFPYLGAGIGCMIVWNGVSTIAAFRTLDPMNVDGPIELFLGINDNNLSDNDKNPNYIRVFTTIWSVTDSAEGLTLNDIKKIAPKM